MCSCYCHRHNRETMDSSRILSVIHIVIIGTVLNFNRGNRQCLKDVTCKQIFIACFQQVCISVGCTPLACWSYLVVVSVSWQGVCLLGGLPSERSLPFERISFWGICLPMPLWECRPPPCEQTDACENITFQQLRFREGNNTLSLKRFAVRLYALVTESRCKYF